MAFRSDLVTNKQKLITMVGDHQQKNFIMLCRFWLLTGCRSLGESVQKGKMLNEVLKKAVKNDIC